MESCAADPRALDADGKSPLSLAQAAASASGASAAAIAVRDLITSAAAPPSAPSAPSALDSDLAASIAADERGAAAAAAAAAAEEHEGGAADADTASATPPTSTSTADADVPATQSVAAPDTPAPVTPPTPAELAASLASPRPFPASLPSPGFGVTPSAMFVHWEQPPPPRGGRPALEWALQAAPRRWGGVLGNWVDATLSVVPYPYTPTVPPLLLLSTKKTYAAVSGLAPGSAYAVRVRARNVNGWGPWGPRCDVDITTAAAPAPGADTASPAAATATGPAAAAAAAVVPAAPAAPPPLSQAAIDAAAAGDVPALAEMALAAAAAAAGAADEAEPATGDGSAAAPSQLPPLPLLHARAEGSGRTVLHIAAAAGAVAVVRWALDPSSTSPSIEPAVVDAGDEAGVTPLQLAVTGGHLACIKVLVGIGMARLDAVNGAGFTPLHYAARHGRVPVLRWLLEAGADPALKGARGVTVREILEARRGAVQAAEAKAAADAKAAAAAAVAQQAAAETAPQTPTPPGGGDEASHGTEAAAVATEQGVQTPVEGGGGSGATVDGDAAPPAATAAAAVGGGGGDSNSGGTQPSAQPPLQVQLRDVNAMLALLDNALALPPPPGATPLLGSSRTTLLVGVTLGKQPPGVALPVAVEVALYKRSALGFWGASGVPLEVPTCLDPYAEAYLTTSSSAALRITAPVIPAATPSASSAASAAPLEVTLRVAPGSTRSALVPLAASPAPSAVLDAAAAGPLAAMVGLTPETRYAIAARARNARGWGPWSPRSADYTTRGAGAWALDPALLALAAAFCNSSELAAMATAGSDAAARAAVEAASAAIASPSPAAATAPPAPSTNSQLARKVDFSAAAAALVGDDGVVGDDDDEDEDDAFVAAAAAAAGRNRGRSDSAADATRAIARLSSAATTAASGATGDAEAPVSPTTVRDCLRKLAATTPQSGRDDSSVGDADVAAWVSAVSSSSTSESAVAALERYAAAAAAAAFAGNVAALAWLAGADSDAAVAAAARSAQMHSGDGSGDEDAAVAAGLRFLAELPAWRAKQRVPSSAATRASALSLLHCAALGGQAGACLWIAELLRLSSAAAAAPHATDRLAAPVLASRSARDGATPLHYAIYSGDVAAVSALLSAAHLPISSAMAMRDDAHGWSPAHYAALSDADDVLQLLLDGAVAENVPDAVTLLFLRDAAGRTPVHLAAGASSHRCLSLLLQLQPSSAWQVDDAGQSPLDFAAAADARLAIALLLGAEADEGNFNLNALNGASTGGHAAAIASAAAAADAAGLVDAALLLRSYRGGGVFVPAPELLRATAVPTPLPPPRRSRGALSVSWTSPSDVLLRLLTPQGDGLADGLDSASARIVDAAVLRCTDAIAASSARLVVEWTPRTLGIPAADCFTLSDTAEAAASDGSVQRGKARVPNPWGAAQFEGLKRPPGRGVPTNIGAGTSTSARGVDARVAVLSPTPTEGFAQKNMRLLLRRPAGTTLVRLLLVVRGAVADGEGTLEDDAEGVVVAASQPAALL